MRTVTQACTKGQCGTHYRIADVGKIEGLKDIGVHSNRVPAFVPLDRCTSKGHGPYDKEGFHAEGNGRHKDQDEARYDDGGNGRTATVLAP